MSEQDHRLEALAAFVLSLASGNYARRELPSEAGDEADALLVGLNMLGEVLETEQRTRRQAEAQLQDRLDAYHATPALLCSVDVQSWTVIVANHTLERRLGLAPGGGVGQCFLDWVPAGARPRWLAALSELAEGEGGEHSGLYLLDAQGERVELLLSGTPALPLPEGPPARLRLVAWDVTARRRLEVQLNQAQKMEAVGRMAAGIAHDFNNMLTVLLGSADLMDATLPLEHEVRSDLEAIREAGSRATTLSRQLLSLSQIQRVAQESADLRQVLTNARSILERSLPSKVRLEVEYGTQPLWVPLNGTQITQLLLNFVVNARDAMPQGGRITLKLGLDPQRGDRVLLQVRDGGQGMPAEVLERALEPFYTTKGPGDGSGLGLSVCYGIIQGAGGELELLSQPGVGTQVLVRLPLESTPELRTEASGDRTAVRRQYSILVVDDDPRVGRVVERSLSSIGHLVSRADGGPAALALTGLQAFDLVITDVSMPGLSGLELARALWARDSEQHVLMVSGQNPPALSSGERANFLAKPFTPDELRVMVDTILS